MVAAIVGDTEGRSRALDASKLVDVPLQKYSLGAVHTDDHRRLVHQNTTHAHVGVLALTILRTGEQQPSWYQLAAFDTCCARIGQPCLMVRARLDLVQQREQTGVAEQLTTSVHTGHRQQDSTVGGAIGLGPTAAQPAHTLLIV